MNLYLQVSDPIYAERNASSSSSDTKFRFFNSSQYCVVSLLISSFETLQRKCCGTVHLCSPISFQLMAMAATSLQLPLTTLFKILLIQIHPWQILDIQVGVLYGSKTYFFIIHLSFFFCPSRIRLFPRAESRDPFRFSSPSPLQSSPTLSKGSDCRKISV